MGKTYNVPIKNRLARSFLRTTFRGVFYLISRVKIEGVENVPKHGAYLIAINHISLYEAPFVVSFWPVPPEVAGAADVWDRPGQSLLARWYGGIQVHRGQYDRKLIDAVLAALQSGHPLLMAPEGGRSHALGMRRAQPGIAYLMEKAGVPVVPVGVTGSTDDFLRRGLRGERPDIGMKIGKPFRLQNNEEKGINRHEARQRNADFIMLQIAALLPLEYRGVYADDQTIFS